MMKKYVQPIIIGTATVLSAALVMSVTLNVYDVVTSNHESPALMSSIQPEYRTIADEHSEKAIAHSSDIANAQNQELPDTINPKIHNNATLVSDKYVIDTDGKLKDAVTGTTVTDPAIVGTSTTMPDPLAKSDGKRYIPVSVEAAREVLKDDSAVNAHQADASQHHASQAAYTLHNAPHVAPIATHSTIQPIANFNSIYGPHWGTDNGQPAFYNADNVLFARNAQKVVDVSEHNAGINWSAVKNSGVNAAILRAGFGAAPGGRADYQFGNNVRQARAVGMPFGVYWFSYSSDAGDAVDEANTLADVLRSQGITSSADMTYPIFLDLENWQYPGHVSPRNPQMYGQIVRAFIDQMHRRGYSNVAVYSYTSYLANEANNDTVHQNTRWVGQYGPHLQYSFRVNGLRGWQYTSEASVDGIGGNVDVTAFTSDLAGGSSSASAENPVVNLTWFVRSENWAVGAAVRGTSRPLEYRWQTYDINKKQWVTISNWQSGNWADWAQPRGSYLLVAQIRDAITHQFLGQGVAGIMEYRPGSSRITGTYAGYRSNGILLGLSSDNPRARYRILIYDYLHGKWVQQWGGQWALWQPVKGVYWTHFELYTSEGNLVETKTYPFGV